MLLTSGCGSSVLAAATGGEPSEVLVVLWACSCWSSVLAAAAGGELSAVLVVLSAWGWSWVLAAGVGG